MIALRVTRRPGATEPDATALALPPEGLTIGRADDCGLVLADPLRVVSRQHAQVIVDGQAARVRCVSSTTPLWVNDVQLDPGGERPLFAGDRLRIGRFELAVEPAARRAAQRSRLDRWFDLDGAPDPLAAESPLPALAPRARGGGNQRGGVLADESARRAHRRTDSAGCEPRWHRRRRPRRPLFRKRHAGHRPPRQPGRSRQPLFRRLRRRLALRLLRGHARPRATSLRHRESRAARQRVRRNCSSLRRLSLAAPALAPR